MSGLKVTLAGLKMPNPTMLASGIMGETGASLCEAAFHGAGAVVTKSIGLEPRPGYQNPTLYEDDSYYINAMGLPGPGITAFAEEMKVARKAGVPVIASIFASNVKDFVAVAGKMEEYRADAVELNLSCPHAKGYGMEIGIEPQVVREIVEQVKGAIRIPVFAKLTPNTHRLVQVGKAVQEGGGDGVVAINTVKAMAISVEFRRPVLSNVQGGLSGPAIKPVGLRCVYDLYENLQIPIIGVGGVESWRDAMEYIMAGAMAVQVGSAIGRCGLGVFRDIVAGLQQFLEEEHCSDLQDLVGVAHER